jgi:hypothetical protein
MVMISRRTILHRLISGTAVGVTGLFSRASAQLHRPVDPAALFTPLKAGGTIGFGWSLEAISPPITGAILLNLVNDSGATARVRVCRRDGEPMGVAHSALLDFVIMNRSGGPTEETLGRAVVAMAEAVMKNEQRLSAEVNLLSNHKQHLASCRV